jgi:drug/metabolite transporter (DMT)-like permease
MPAGLGIASAFGASVLYNAGAALQALEAREVPGAHSLRPSLIGRLLSRPRWLAGSALTLLGWPLQAVALTVAPLTIVQPILAAGLLLLLVIGVKALGEPAGPRELLGVGAIVAGVALLAWSAPSHSADHAAGLTLAAALAALAIPALAPYAARRHLPNGALLALAAGFGYGWSGITTKLFADGASGGAWGAALAWSLATGGASLLALLSEMTAFQRAPATRVCPTVFSAQVIVPVLAAPLLAGEGWGSTPLSGGVIVVGLLTVVAGVVALGASRAVGTLAGSASAMAESPRACSEARSVSSRRRDAAEEETALTTTT